VFFFWAVRKAGVGEPFCFRLILLLSLLIILKVVPQIGGF